MHFDHHFIIYTTLEAFGTLFNCDSRISTTWHIEALRATCYAGIDGIEIDSTWSAIVSRTVIGMVTSDLRNATESTARDPEDGFARNRMRGWNVVFPDGSTTMTTTVRVSDVTLTTTNHHAAAAAHLQSWSDGSSSRNVRRTIAILHHHRDDQHSC